jgi:hypothetical protein
MRANRPSERGLTLYQLLVTLVALVMAVSLFTTAAIPSRSLPIWSFPGLSDHLRSGLR